MRRLVTLAAATLLAFSISASAQEQPGKPDLSRISAGTYDVDANHAQVIWTVDHLGFTPLSGMFGRISGTLVLDPKTPHDAKLDITIAIAGLAVTTAAFGEHLATADFFDREKFPTARFVSTRVKAEGTKATIEGDLTLHGITRPLVMEASFNGVGYNPNHKVDNLGFLATAELKRSEFGLGRGAPMISDEVTLKIIGAFRKQP